MRELRLLVYGERTIWYRRIQFLVFSCLPLKGFLRYNKLR